MSQENRFSQIDREVRLMASLCSTDYRKCFRRLEENMQQYTPEEKARIQKSIMENRNYVLIGDEDYPQKLYDMEWPPLILFYEGDLHLLKRPSAGIVGSRKCSYYGRKVTEVLSTALSKIGMVIISGGARGVDTAAHTASLKESGKTVCVLGCGLDIPYPKENESLFSEIREQGLLITEYPRGFGPMKWTFPMRNRIIAGLSDHILVTEATEKSGSLHTASYGEEINRQIHAVPHDYFTKSGKGNNLLIEMGAKILSDKKHLLVDLLSDHIESLWFRIEDLELQELRPGIRDLEKIFGLEEMDFNWKEELIALLNERDYKL